MTDHLAQLHAALDADPENWELRLLGSDEIEAAGDADLANYYRWTARVLFRPYKSFFDGEWLVHSWQKGDRWRGMSDLPSYMADELNPCYPSLDRWRHYTSRQAAELDVARVVKAFGYPDLQEVK